MFMISLTTDCPNRAGFSPSGNSEAGVSGLAGLEALDERRRLGLPDGSLLGQWSPNPKKSKPLTVSESFARKHFPADRSHVSRHVTRDQLRAGDVIPEDHSGPGYTFADLPADRLIELWLAGK